MDTSRDRLVIFGGNNGPRLRDTWEWDGARWIYAGENGPSARNSHSMVFDAARSRSIVFGGFNGSFLDEHWQWDGTAWQPFVGARPSARVGAGMAFDAVRSRVVLFGGAIAQDGSGTGGIALADTWEFDGQSWQQASAGGPAGRSGHAMFFDPTRSAVIIHGGTDLHATLGDTWAWNGAQWSPVQSEGPFDSCVTGTFDAASARPIIMTGTGELWTLDGDTWRFVQAPGPTGRCTNFLAYRPASASVLLFGAEPNQPPSEPLWMLQTGGPLVRPVSLRVAVDLGAPAVLAAQTVDPGPVTLRWMRGDQPVENGDGVDGSTTQTLTIDAVEPSDAGLYTLATTSAFCTAPGGPIELLVICPTDMNRDGRVNPDDLGDFINCYFGDSTCGNLDFNVDGNIDPDDLGDYINAYFAGC